MTRIAHDICPISKRCGMYDTMRETNQRLHRRVQQAESKQLAEIVRPLQDKLQSYELSRKFAKEWFDQHGINWFFSHSESERTLVALLLEENRLLKEQLVTVMANYNEALDARHPAFMERQRETD